MRGRGAQLDGAGRFRISAPRGDIPGSSYRLGAAVGIIILRRGAAPLFWWVDFRPLWSNPGYNNADYMTAYYKKQGKTGRLGNPIPISAPGSR